MHPYPLFSIILWKNVNCYLQSNFTFGNKLTVRLANLFFKFFIFIFFTFKLMLNCGIKITFTSFNKDILLHAIYLLNHLSCLNKNLLRMVKFRFVSTCNWDLIHISCHSVGLTQVTRCSTCQALTNYDNKQLNSNN